MSAIDTRSACIVAVVWCIIYRESHCQVSVVLSPRQTADNGSTTTFNCSYLTTDTSYSFFDLEWRKGDTIENSYRIANFLPELNEARYFFNYTPPHFVASRDNQTNSGTLDIAQVNFADDGGLYWCRVTVLSVDLADARDAKSAHLTIIVLPSIIALSDSTSGSLSAGSTLRVVPGEERRFTCVVYGINPGARFEWTVGGLVVGRDAPSSNVSGSDGLVTSESTATLSFPTENHGMILECRAINKDGHSGIAVGVTLYVKVTLHPPTDVTADHDKITATTIKVKWTPGNNGADDQWFYISFREVKMKEFGPVSKSDRIDTNEHQLEELKPYTTYEINLYAENATGISGDVALNVTTLPDTSRNVGIDVIVRQATGTVSSRNIPQYKDTSSCLQLEFRLEASEWFAYGACLKEDADVAIREIRSRYCYGSICSESSPSGTDYFRRDILLISVIGILVLLVVIVLVIITLIYRRNIRKQPTIDKSVVPGRNKKFTSRSKDVTEKEAEYHELDTPMRRTVDDKSTSKIPTVDVATATPRDRITIEKELGQGAFGMVLLAEVRSILQRGVVSQVAIKTLKDGAGPLQREDLLRELQLMKKIPRHRNIVKLLGFCVEDDPIYIIIEFLSKGNLKDLLIGSRGKGMATTQFYQNLHGASKSLTSRDLMSMAIDVAEGMAFLETHKCIHRDLAARNVLVSQDMVCKVADFGLARDIKNTRNYQRQSQGPLPLRWMSLESILDGVYTGSSDVWSFGVLLWEIVTLGARPYPSMSPKTMIAELRAGYRMPKPDHCLDDFYQMMLGCWSEDPDDRLSFTKLSNSLRELLESASDYISLIEYQESLYEVTVPSTSDEKV